MQSVQTADISCCPRGGDDSSALIDDCCPEKRGLWALSGDHQEGDSMYSARQTRK